MDMDVKDLNAAFMEVPFTLTLLPILSMLNVKQAWEQVRLSWARPDLNRCVGILLV